MLLWLESQDTAVITVLVFALCYMLAAVVFFATRMTAHRPTAAELKATSPVMLTPLAVLAGLLVAFLASRVWSNLDRANTYVAQAASALRQSVLLAETLPPDVRTAVRAAIKKHLQFIEAKDWPDMADGRANLRQPPLGLTDAMAALLSFVPAQPGQLAVQQRAIVTLEQALDARRNRIVLSQAAIAPIQWLVIVLLDILILVTIAMVHIDRQVAAAANLFTFSTAVAACLVLLMVNDRPFASGGFTVQPAALREVALE
jgi:hypothetical protein